MELMGAALPSSKDFDSTGRRADGCAELPLKATASDDAGAAYDGRRCPEEVEAISKRWSGGQVTRGRAAFISWLNSREIAIF